MKKDALNGIMDAFARECRELGLKVTYQRMEIFRVAVSTQGGSMGRTSRQIFDLLGIPTGPGGIVEYLHFAESPR